MSWRHALPTTISFSEHVVSIWAFIAVSALIFSSNQTSAYFQGRSVHGQQPLPQTDIHHQTLQALGNAGLLASYAAPHRSPVVRKMRMATIQGVLRKCRNPKFHDDLPTEQVVAQCFYVTGALNVLMKYECMTLAALRRSLRPYRSTIDQKVSSQMRAPPRVQTRDRRRYELFNNQRHLSKLHAFDGVGRPQGLRAIQKINGRKRGVRERILHLQQLGLYHPHPPGQRPHHHHGRFRRDAGERLTEEDNPLDLSTGDPSGVYQAKRKKRQAGGPGQMQPDGYSPEQWQWVLAKRAPPTTDVCWRVEYRQAGYWGRYNFHSAIRILKADITLPPYNESKYDILVRLHFNRFGTQTSHPGAHRGAAFLPWHRIYLLIFENAIREAVPSACLVYWNPVHEQLHGNDSGRTHLWTETFNGNANGPISTGPYKQWLSRLPLPSFFPGGPTNNVLRDLNNPEFAELFGATLWSEAATNRFFSKNSYNQLVWCNDADVEGDHNLNHLALGGYMLHGQISAYDPFFIPWHAFVDCLWEAWRFNVQRFRESPYTYPANGCSQEHAPRANMEPFGIPNYFGLRDISRIYRCIGPSYCSAASPTCQSRETGLLYCDRATWLCKATKVAGSSCVSAEECFESVCMRGRCVPNRPAGFCDPSRLNTCTFVPADQGFE